MVRRTVNCGDGEPEQKTFEKPSEGEHLFQIVDVFDSTNAPGKMVLDDDTVCVKLEVAIGDEMGRTMLQRLSLDDQWKGFFATRLFLKAISLPHKGQIDIDTEDFIGRQFYATVVHKDGYANIKEYSFDKVVEQAVSASGNPDGVTKPEDISWGE